LISILAEQLSEGRVRQVEILVDSRPGAILSAVSNLQPRQLL
jgi:chromosomal replication initiator protein